MKLYNIKGWSDHYENNRTRELKSLEWVPIPNDQDGDGYTLIMEHTDGAAIYGAWIACVQVASKCDPRGTLMRGCKTPHNAASLSRMTRVPIKIIERMINVCERECKWLESNDMQDGATIPQDGATIPQDGAPRVRAQNGMEWNGMEEKEGKEIVDFLNSESGSKFTLSDAHLKFITARVTDAKGDLPGIKKMITRQAKLWKGTEFEKYLRPETLFNATKFPSYYGQRDMPIIREQDLIPQPQKPQRRYVPDA